MREAWKSDFKRVLNDYNSSENIIIPPDDYYQHIYVNEYKDGSGYHVDLDLWYRNGQSDLTLQLDIRKKGYDKLILNKIAARWPAKAVAQFFYS